MSGGAVQRGRPRASNHRPVEDPPRTIARATGPRGEIVLRRRGVGDDAVDELIVNGAFAMDSAETTSERALAALAWPGATVLVGGLGLGFTVTALLDARVAAVDVVEIESALIEWARAGVAPPLGRVATDPRVRLWVADVRDVLAAEDADPTGPWDAILLDVDNGPDFLIHAENAALYHAGALRTAYRRLTSGGVLAIWCQGTDPGLWARMRALTPAAREERHVAQRGRHRIEYVIYTVHAPG
jgi:spermidine synthase